MLTRVQLAMSVYSQSNVVRARDVWLNTCTCVQIVFPKSDSRPSYQHVRQRGDEEIGALRASLIPCRHHPSMLSPLKVEIAGAEHNIISYKLYSIVHAEASPCASWRPSPPPASVAVCFILSGGGGAVSRTDATHDTFVSSISSIVPTASWLSEQPCGRLVMQARGALRTYVVSSP